MQEKQTLTKRGDQFVNQNSGVCRSFPVVDSFILSFAIRNKINHISGLLLPDVPFVLNLKF